LIDKAGQGGMGVVYKARHTLLDRVDAVKVLPQERTSDGEAVKRFLREMKVVGQLAHPNLIQARYADQIEGTWLLVTDWVDGETLSQRVQRMGAMSPGEACEAICQAAMGLQHAHDRGVVHRDIKPGNLMRTTTGEIKVLDLGLARLRGEFGLAGDATGSGMILGTADYIAPEQIGEAKHADHRADVYSLGCTLYFLLSGQVPFPQPNTLQKLLAHQEHEPMPLERVCRGLPTGLSAVVARMMAKVPEARYQSMNEVITALRPFTRQRVAAEENTAMLRQQALAEMKREEAAPAPPPPRSRRRLIVTAATFLVTIAAAAGIIFKLQGTDGVVVVEVMEPGVEVLVDGNSVIVESKTTGPVTIAPGEHEVVVKRGDETLYTKAFRLEKRGKEIVRATWQTKPPPVVKQAPPGVLDRLDPEKLPRREPGMPKEVVGVIGSRREDGKLGYFTQIALSKDGTKLLVGSSVTGEPFALWDLESMRELHRFTLKPNRGLSGFALSPDGSLVAAWFAHDHIRLYDAKSGQEVGTLAGSDDVVMDAAFSPDGKLLAASHRDGHDQPCTIKLWDMKERKEVGQMKGHRHYVYSVSWSPDGKYLLTASSDRTARLWDVAGRRELWKHEETGTKATVVAVAFSPAGGLAASSGDVDVPPRLWTVGQGRLEHMRPLARQGSEGVIHALAFRPDGGLLAASSNEGDLTIWDTARGKQLHQWKLSKGLQKVAFAPDGRHLLAGIGDGSAYILRLTSK
jgi:tRNA A-37 threonylcarbamoyl transferase component Bud32